MSLRGRLDGANKGLVKRFCGSPRATREFILESVSWAGTALAGPADPTFVTNIAESLM